MKLLIFIHSLSSGGAERVATNLANWWADKGWTVTLATLTNTDQDFFPIHPAINRISLCLDSESSGLFGGIVNNLKRILALKSALNQQKPDIAISFMTTANILLALAASKLDIPIIGSERTHPPMYPLNRPWEWLRRHVYGHLSAVVALSTDSALWLTENTNAPIVKVIPNAVTYPLPPHPPVVHPRISFDGSANLLAVGRLGVEKGFDRLISAFSVIAPEFPEWNLTILGEGGARAALENQCKELQLESRIFLPGRVGNVGEWYKNADLFVMTSLYEGFPNTLIEAMSYELAVVSTNCETGPRDIIRHEIDGLLICPDNPKQLIDALKRLMRHDELRQRYANRSKEVRERFSMGRVVGIWESLFESLTKRDT